MRMIINVIKALDFAARKHRDQRRKGAGSEPYINHLTEVAFLVAEATEGEATTALIAALPACRFSRKDLTKQGYKL
jgi:guanosine-3',5'-bis(diphosphate) 3'-pyrophosphohydrolase